jgi:adenylyl-sulfate kinase
LNNTRFLSDGSTGSIWVMGLSAAGKSTLAHLLIDRLTANGYPAMLLDGDEIRDLFELRLGFDEKSRRQQTRRVVKLAQWVSGQSVLPVVAIMHPFEGDRAWCRESLDNYYEIFLQCDLKTCMKRDQKNLYARALKGEIDMVAGLDMPYDEPLHPDLVLESDKLTPEELLDALWRDIENRIGD